MNIIIKPMGLVVLGVLFSVLIALIVRGNSVESPYGAPTKSGSVVKGTRKVFLYEDAVAEGWTTQYSWAKDMKLSDRENTFSGKKSIRLVMQPWEGIKFTKPNFDATPFDRLAFRVHPGDNASLLLQVHGGVEGKGNHPKTWELVGPLVVGHWNICIVPLKDLDIADRKNVNSLTIQDGTGKPTQPFFVDDVQLLPKGAQPPVGVPATVSVQPEK